MKKQQYTELGGVCGIDLPKWPLCLIQGPDVGRTLALEIIRRTDIFFQSVYSGGNDMEFDDMVREMVRYPSGDQGLLDRLCEWKARWGYLNINYLVNDWISSCWIGGPHGWMHPDGTVACRCHIGKWPRVEDVINDLDILGGAFPSLELTVTLCGEGDGAGIEPLASLELRSGEVRALAGPMSLEMNSYALEMGNKPSPDGYGNTGTFLDSEHGISMDVIREWSRRIKDV